jgi:CysZ protein
MPSNLASRFEELVVGFTTPLRVMKLLIDHPKLFALFLLPMAITIFVISGLIYALLAGLGALVMPLLSGLVGSYAGALGTLLGILAGMALVWLSFQFLAVILAGIASPLNDRLALETERALGVNPVEPGFMLTVSLFWLDIRKTVLALGALLALAAFGLLPVVGIFSWLGVALVNTFVYLTYPMNRRQAGIRESLSWILLHPTRSIGFGIATSLLFAIPVINLFALPVSVVGGTLLYLRK